MLRLIATDMDGTFLRDDLTYDEALFAEMHQQMVKRGIQWVVASGNQYFQLRSFFENYPDTIYLSENGAYARQFDHVIASHAFSPVDTSEIIKIISSIPDLKMLVCGEDSAYALDTLDPAYIEHMRHYYYHLNTVHDYTEINDHILKFALSCKPEETEAKVAELRKKLHGLAVPASSGHGDIDIIHPNVNKATGLMELGELLGIQLDEMMTFGDGGNDLEMIAEAGLGVAMLNAQPAVKVAANAITPVDNNAQGELVYLKNYFTEH